MHYPVMESETWNEALPDFHSSLCRLELEDENDSNFSVRYIDLTTVTTLNRQKFFTLSRSAENLLVESKLSEGSIVGLVIDQNKPSYIYVLPTLYTLFKLGFKPFCIDPSQLPITWILDSLCYLEISRLFLFEEDALNFLQDHLKIKRKASGDVGVFLADVAVQTELHPLEEPPPRSDFLFVVQTSGTTGRRKTVFVTKESIIPNVMDFQDTFQLTNNDMILSCSPPTFDPFYVDILLSLLFKISIVFVSNHVKNSHKLLSDLIVQEQRISFFQMTPGLFKKIFTRIKQNSGAIKHIVLGGEPFPSLESLVPGIRFFQAYGITEMSCWQTLYEVGNCSDTPIYDPGKKNYLTQSEIFIDEGKDEGEIFVKSLTRRCIISPNEPREDDAISTQDVGRRVNGKIYFTDRCKHHVKINGKRVSLLESVSAVETTTKFSTHCIIHPEKRDSIVGFVQADEKLMPWVEQECRKAIPSHLCPSKFYAISEFPLNGHGKVDRHALEKRLLEARLFDKPRPKLDLKELWRKFTLSDPQTDSNFFLSGGDSFKAIQLISVIEETLMIECPDLFEILSEKTFNELKKYCESWTMVAPQTVSQNFNLSKAPSNLNCDQWNVATKGISFGQLLITGSIETLDLESLWNVHMEKCIDASALVTVEKKTQRICCFIGSHSGKFLSVDLEKGKVVWETRLPGRIEGTAAVSPNGNCILIGCYDCCMYCLDINNGSIVWSFQSDGIIKCTSSFHGDSVIFGSYDHHVYFLSLANGDLRRKLNSANSSITAKPLVMDDQSVIVAGLNGTVVSIGLECGTCLWKTNLKSPVFGNPGLTKQSIVTATAKGDIFGMDKWTGTIQWHFKAENSVFTSIVVSTLSEKILFGCHDGCLYCLDHLGHLLHKIPHSKPIYATPIVCQTSGKDYVVAVTTDGQMTVTDLAKKIVVKEFQLKGQADVFSSPVIWNNKLVIGMRNDYLFCFDLK